MGSSSDRDPWMRQQSRPPRTAKRGSPTIDRVARPTWVWAIRARVAKCRPKHARNLARLEGLEPPTTWFEARYSIQLSYRRVVRWRFYQRSNAGRDSIPTAACCPSPLSPLRFVAVAGPGPARCTVKRQAAPDTLVPRACRSGAREGRQPILPGSKAASCPGADSRLFPRSGPRP